MNMKYPYQNQDAEDSKGLNKKMNEELKKQEDNDSDDRFIKVTNMEQFMVGDIFEEQENGRFSLLKSPSSTKCPLCK